MNPYRSSTDWRSYRSLLGSYLCCNVGDGIVLVFLTIVASQASRSPRDLSWVVSSLSLPWLLLSLFAGVWIDRFGPLRTAQGANLVRAGLLLAVGLAFHAFMAPIALLCLTGACIGTCEVLVDTAAPLLVPRIVASDDLEKANGYVSSIEIIGHKFLGANLGAVLSRLHGVLSALLGAGLYALSALLLFNASARPGMADSRTAERPGFLVELAAGLRFFMGHTGLRIFAGIGLLWNFCTGAEQSFLILYVQENLAMGDWFYGALLSAGGIGAVAGSLFVERAILGLGHFTVLAGTLGVFAFQFLARGLWIAPWVALTCLFLNGVALVLLSAVTMSYRQRQCPPAVFGRVNAIIRMLGLGALPLGALVGGMLGEYWFTYPSLFRLLGLFALGAALASIWLVRANGVLAEATESRGGA